MLVLTGHFDLDADAISRGVELARELARDTAAAPGCLQYSFAIDVVRPGRLHVIEYWADQNSLERHLEGAATQRFRRCFSMLCVNEITFRVHEAIELAPSHTLT